MKFNQLVEIFGATITILGLGLLFWLAWVIF